MSGLIVFKIDEIFQLLIGTSSTRINRLKIVDFVVNFKGLYIDIFFDRSVSSETEKSE